MSHSIIYFRSIHSSRALFMSRSAREPATPKRALINLEVIYTDLYPSELSGVCAFLSKSHIIFIDSFFCRNNPFKIVSQGHRISNIK